MATTTIKICALLLGIAFLSSTDRGSAGTARPDFSAVLTAHSRALASITEDAQAKILFSSVLAPALGLDGNLMVSPVASPSPAPVMPRRKGSKQTDRMPSQESPADAETGVTAVRLVGELAAWRLASRLKEAGDMGQPALLIALKEVEGQRAWLLGPDPATRQSLRRTLLISETLAAFEPARDGESPAGYAEYAARMDRALPLNRSESLVALVERDGQKGVRHRLKSEAEAVTWTDVERDLFVARYFETHLLPILNAHLQAAASRAEAEAERNSRDAWESLQAGQERLSAHRGLARLCGSWQWTLHNHQNHQDHKMVMVFDPPPQHSIDRPAGAIDRSAGAIDRPAGADGPPTTANGQGSADQAANQPAGRQSLRPAKIVVLGEAVYLRWESPDGFQEDSLLFTGEGKRLEGSFTNSAGAWGSITGKRVAACK